jgi:hypothetical protein
MSTATFAITHYCERVGDGFWAEPVNAFTNLAFIVAAVLLVPALRRVGVAARSIWDLWSLTLLIAVIGVGSFLWHTLATPWSELADVIPILLFISLFILSFLVRIAGLAWLGVLAWFTLYHAVNVGLQSTVPADFLNGSVFYLPTWASLWIMVGYCRLTGNEAAGWLLGAALMFTLSLLLRTLDNALCADWPLGTHFGWHLFNGATLYLTVRGLLTNAALANRSPGKVSRARPA